MSRVIPNALKRKKDARKFFGTDSALGTVAGTDVSIDQTSTSGFVQRVIRFVNTPLPLIDSAGVVARCALKFFDFPDGQVKITGCTADLVLTKSATGVNLDWNGDFSVGTVAAAADATLSSTEQNVIPTTATPQAVAGVTTAKGIQTTELTVDGTTTAVDLYLNVLVDDADQDVTTTPTNLIANGTVTLTYAMLGDK